MTAAKRISPLVLVALVLGGAQRAGAQELFSVTGVSRAGGATLEVEGAAALPLSTGRALTPGTIHVLDGTQLMLFEPSGVVMGIIGPATVVAARDDLTGGIQLNLEGGRVVVASARRMGEGRVITLTARPSAAGQVNVELSVSPGYTYVLAGDKGVGVAYVADAPDSALGVRVNAASVELPTNQLLMVDSSGAHRLAPLGDWLTQNGFARAWGRELGVASAQVSRRDVESGLFNNIISWDRYASATTVSERLREQAFNPEIRQTAQLVAFTSRPSTRAAPAQTEPFAAANAVPLISPAALSVQTIGQGVTALQLNQSAANLLTATGSQGLGFRGLLQLAVPGISGGQRTIGPAGLAAP